LANVEVFALDISKEALKVAKENATRNKVEITFIESDILTETNWNLELKGLKFDVIVSNPPYVRQLEKVEIQPNVLNNEPHLALFVEDHNPLKFYKAIAGFASERLKPKGNLYFEINQYLGEETKEVLLDGNFDKIELIKDLNGNNRMLTGTKQ
jgi:release factor glutamine methyltransferase